MLSNSCKYSPKEIQLLTLLGYQYLFSEDQASVFPPTIYRMATHDAFLSNLQGPLADSLRRCAKAIDNCDPYRMTPEFDALIDLAPDADKEVDV